jgi:hypothetical protein
MAGIKQRAEYSTKLWVKKGRKAALVDVSDLKGAPEPNVMNSVRPSRNSKAKKNNCHGSRWAGANN